MDKMSRSILVAYFMAVAMLGLAIWLSGDWHWAVRGPILLYLALCTLLFPLAKIPADLLVAGILIGSFIHVTGLVAWIALAAVYIVAWICAPLLAPLGGFLRHTTKKARPE